MSSYGKLSVSGSPKFESELSLVLDNIAKEIKESIDRKYYEAVILMGGYGRGEGGVITVDGKEYPHNNFDFVIISKKISQEIKEILDIEFMQIFKKHTKPINIDVEFSIISSSKLKNHQPMVITYDMKYGHKLIAGDASVLSENENFELDTIPAWDIRNLMVNRGTLLIINDLMLEKKELSLNEKKIIIKHLVKAVIGYGDALLYHLGNYHYSYVQKNILMQNQTEVDPKFKEIYKLAMQFRFSPNYEMYLNFDLHNLQNKIKKQLHEVHILCEQMSLKNNALNWANYIPTVLNNTLYEDLGVKNILKKGYNLIKDTPYISSFSILNNIKLRSTGIKGMMPILFPLIAFDINNSNVKNIMEDFFRLNSSEDINRYKSAYLSYWGKYINSNFVKEDYGLQERVL